MQGYDPRVDAAELVRRHGPEKAQQIIAAFMRDRGMSDRNSEIWSGLDVRTAQRGMEPADLSDGMAGAPQTQVGDDATLAGEDGSGRDWGNWRPGDPLPTVGGGGMRSGDDSQRGRGYQKVPGPRTLDGKPTAPGDTMWDPEAIEQYTTRQQDPETGMYSPSPKDSDMQKRGMVPVFNDDGSVGYSVAYGTGMQGGPGRAGPRKDLEKAKWVQETVPGPTGNQLVYRPGEEATKRYKAQDDDRARIRLAKRAGISGSEAMGMSVDDLRRSAKAAGIDDHNARKAAWRAQSMLAGGQPTGGLGGSKAITNALMTLPEDQRNSSLRYMLPGGDRAAAVDANNAATAARMAQNAVTAFLTNNPGATPEQRAMLRQKQREANPSAAGAADISGGNYESPEAQAELDRLAGSFDNSWGGFSYDNERSLAGALQQQYGLSQAEAEALAYRYAEKRRWFFNQGGPRASAQGAPATGAPAPNAPAPPSPWATGGV